MSIPSGYKRLEYIQSSGTQYIDTGIIGSYDTRVTAEFEILSIGSGTTFVFGSQADNNVRFCLGITSAGVFRSDYGTEYIEGPNAATGTKYTADKNRNVCTINGTAINSNAQTFTGSTNIYLFARSYSSLSYANLKMYGCKIYSNDVLVRDLVPCKNASGVVGMWDDVNDTFYSNAGSGTFTAGPEVAGSNRVLVNAKGYAANSGTVLINGMVYHLKKGRGLLNGMGYDISFTSGVPLSEITTGTILYINESGTPVPFYVAKHDYESGLNGAGRTLVVRKDCYTMGSLGYSSNAYANGALDDWLNNTYINLLSSALRTAIGTTKFYYTPGNGNTTVTTLQRAVFQLSLTELGKTESYANTEGSALPIASTLKIAYRNGSAVVQWTRTPHNYGTNYGYALKTNGEVETDYIYYTYSYGYRPAFTLPATTNVQDNGDGTYSLAG